MMRRIYVSLAVVLAAVVLVGCTSDGTPKPTLSWEQRLETQQLYFSAPNYVWSDASKAEVAKRLDAILEAGLDGPSIEFGGFDLVSEYLGQPDNEALAARYRKSIKAWDENWQPALEARDLVAHVAFLNTNSKKNNTVSDTEWAKLANEFIDKCGTRNKIVLPASETDSRTRASIRTTLDRAFRSRMGSQTIRYGGSSGLREYHSQRGNDVPRGDKNLLVVSDSGPAIAYLYGGDWKQGGTPNLANITTYVTAIGNAGASGAVYSFGRKFDKDGCKAAGKAWGSR